MSNSYDAQKSSKRNTREPKTVATAPARSQQEKAVSDGERSLTPAEGKNRSFGNQLQVAPVKDRLKTPLNNYSNTLLPAVANPSGEAQYGDPYSKKSPQKKPTNLV